MRAPTKTYIGKPCKGCGGTVRYESCNRCVSCAHKNSQKWYNENPEHFEKYREGHKESQLAYLKVWRKDNRDYYRDYLANWHKRNPDYDKERHERTREQNRPIRRAYLKNRYAQDPVYRLAQLIRTRLRISFRHGGYIKDAYTTEIMGCSFEYLKEYLEKLFWPGMTWENLGDWQIDHKIPMASANTLEDVVRLSNHTNLQPLWADDNLSKSDRLDWTPLESMHPLG